MLWLERFLSARMRLSAGERRCGRLFRSFRSHGMLSHSLARIFDGPGEGASSFFIFHLSFDISHLSSQSKSHQFIVEEPINRSHSSVPVAEVSGLKRGLKRGPE